MSELPIERLAEFLVEAKRHTYAAATGEAAVPSIIPGSKQLEYRLGDLFYRDVYYGGEFFVGQETVYRAEEPVWAMSYAGGILFDVTGDLTPIYEFLRLALRQVAADRPFRGPALFRSDLFQYTNAANGTAARFNGVETIGRMRHVVYELRYAGGLLRE